MASPSPHVEGAVTWAQLPLESVFSLSPSCGPLYGDGFEALSLQSRLRSSGEPPVSLVFEVFQKTPEGLAHLCYLIRFREAAKDFSVWPTFQPFIFDKKNPMATKLEGKG